MNQLSSIFNSRLKPVWVTAIFIAAVFLCDFLVFQVSFLMYRQQYSGGAVVDNDEIFLLGTSHLDRDVDLSVLSRELGTSVGIFAIHGASLIPRYYALKEKLAQKKLPRLVVIEVSPWILNRVRYKDDVSAPLIPFYHQGIMAEYVKQYATRDREWYFKNIFKVYSMNFGFTYFFLSPMKIGKAVANRFFSGDTFDRLQSLAGKASETPPPQIDPKDDPRISEWREYDAHGKNFIEPELQAKFEEMLGWLQEKKIKTILLQVPVYKFDGREQFSPELQKLLDGYASAKKAALYQLSLGNNSLLFEDSGHLDQKYARRRYTLSLANAIREDKLIDLGP
jgi:hypothetical protein